MKYLIGFITILTLNSCGFCNVLTKQYYFTSEGGIRPGKNKFKDRKEPYVLKEQDLIKTNSVYQLCSAWNKENLKNEVADCDSTNATVSFIRFFENGRFLMNELDVEKNHLEQYNNLKDGKIGYYKIENGDLILEYFSVYFGGMASDCGKYYRKKYKLKESGIKLYSERKSSSGTFYVWAEVEYSNWFHKKIINGLEGIPDW